MKTLIKKLIPECLLSAYHYVLACVAAFLYGYPSRKLIVIGVTGTNGKSTTTEFIGRILESAGHRVGWTGTASFKVADQEWTNDQKMTMLGRFQTQKLLRQMVTAGCTHAIIETSSQGIAQFRHIGIKYDVVVFTNLTPEHIEAHGGFENYKRAKGKLFEHMGAAGISVVNLDDPNSEYFLSFPSRKKIGYGISYFLSERSESKGLTDTILATDVKLSPDASCFMLHALLFTLHPIGRFNLYNALAAISACHAVDLSWNQIHSGVSQLKSVPGRLEVINEGQPFSVIVDYAYEPAALSAVYETLSLIQTNGKLIHVLGSAGGGRDVARREVLGRMAAEHADVVIVTNEDPYDDDPAEIIRQVADGARAVQSGRQWGPATGHPIVLARSRLREPLAAGDRDPVPSPPLQDSRPELFEILDRQEAIDRAIDLAEPGDLVLITGKGCEPVMAVAHGKKIPWDDRDAVRRSLRKKGYGASH